MACLYPINIKVVKDGVYKGRANVPCGRCAGCLMARRNEWTFRILQEHKTANEAAFVTLTYQNKYLPKNNGTPTLKKEDLQKYFKRVRKRTAAKFRYYAVGEYGEKYNRPHYHIIAFNVKPEILVDSWQSPSGELIGKVTVDPVTQGTIHYCTKYITGNKYYGYKKKIKPFALMSKGLGKNYIDENAEYHRRKMNSEVTYKGGRKQIMPRYYRQKIYSDEEREEIGKRNLQKAMEGITKANYETEMLKRKYVRIMAKRSAKSNDL
jgi:hypothetical protein